jgi:hypothetical protein
MDFFFIIDFRWDDLDLFKLEKEECELCRDFEGLTNDFLLLLGENNDFRLWETLDFLLRNDWLDFLLLGEACRKLLSFGFFWLFERELRLG